MENINGGDTVRHKTLINLNGGLAFNVLEVEDDRAFCDFFDEKGVNQQEWFSLSDLILVNKAKGGFFLVKPLLRLLIPPPIYLYGSEII